MGSHGIGKSTLILQICDKVKGEGKVLYVSGEESAEQIKIRADRLGINNDSILFLGETDIEIIEDAITRVNPKLVIIDSIQTMYSDEITSSPGSVSQVREITSKIMRTCKEQAITTIIIGHVTKDRKHCRTKSFRTHGRYSFIPRRRTIFFIQNIKRCKK